MITIAIDPDDPRLTAVVRPHGLNTRTRQPRLYRFYDELGGLLYVGITSNFPERWTAHRRTADWWPLVALVTVSDPYPYTAAAEESERLAIKSEGPRFNKRSAPGWVRSHSVSHA